MKKLLITAAALLFTSNVFSATDARAVSVDFTDASWSVVAGNNSFTTSVGGVDLTLSAFTLGFPFGDLSWTAGDGIGVDSILGYQSDEIEGVEGLLLTFSEAVILSQITITDLFVEAGLVGNYAEVGSFQIGGNPPVNFSSAGGAGNLDISLPDIVASSILFTAPGLQTSFLPPFLSAHEFSVGGVEFTAVPEPASILLLGSGLLGALGLRRRRA